MKAPLFKACVQGDVEWLKDCIATGAAAQLKTLPHLVGTVHATSPRLLCG
jgi:hypothetical protein